MTSLRDLGRKYIWGVTELKQESRVARALVSDIEPLESNKPTSSISLKGLRLIAMKEPLVRKAIYKKIRDTFKNWFTIKPVDSDGKVDPIDLKIIQDFDKKARFPYRLFISGVCANIYGTGFIEKIYREHGNTKASNKPSATAKLVNLENLNSENIKKRKKSNKKGDKTLYPVYSKMGDEILIHPDRLEIVRIDWLPGSFLGVSTIDVLSNILQSKMTADKASGDFVDWISKGLIDVTIDGCDDTQEKKAKEVLKKHPSYLIHDEETTVNVHSPQRIDLNSFFEYFYVNIAAGLEMPKHILTGSDMGNVTGTEVGISAYYSDIENIQRLVFTPIIENIYTELLKSHGRTWKYIIDWNPIFVDELSEAKILQSRSYSAVESKNSNIISVEEARKILSEGVVDLDIKKIPEKPDVNPVEKPKTNPNINPQPVIKPMSYTPFLTKNEQDMIRRWKEYCMKEVEEQEKRLQEAAKRVKKT